jgi:hypothetical protein
MLALGIYELGLCSCNYHVSLTSDLENVFEIEERICNVCRSVERYRRVQTERDAQDKSDQPTEPRPSDGRKTGVRRLSALEAAERRDVLQQRRAAREKPTVPT